MPEPTTARSVSRCVVKGKHRSAAPYRVVFGQPRQEDLIEYLAGVDDQSILNELWIDLSP